MEGLKMDEMALEDLVRENDEILLRELLEQTRTMHALLCDMTDTIGTIAKAQALRQSIKEMTDEAAEGPLQ